MRGNIASMFIQMHNELVYEFSQKPFSCRSPVIIVKIPTEIKDKCP
jgi:hypothetical protein